MTRYRLGVDIGGTFTDLVLLDEQSGALYFDKTLTTHDEPAKGVMRGIVTLLSRVGIDASDVHDLVHGTTLVTNAVLERTGVKTALLTTKGFRDVAEIGRELRYYIYDLFLNLPDPIVPRNLCYEATERVNRDGELLIPLDLDGLGSTLVEMEARGVQAIAVCYLHSFMNPENERRTAAYIRERYPDIHVSLSSDVLPEIREYERTVATSINAFVQPVVKQYLEDLKSKVRDIGISGEIHIMNSSGRLTTVTGAMQRPIELLESGPAGGSMAGAFYGSLLDASSLLTFDMGGTTAKASVIREGKPDITNQFETDRVRRFRKGSGLPVRIPVIDMIEIGAGGGSTAHIDALGLLRVGPKSAGADPGPACYGKGGSEPAVTDADLILGYLDPDYFLGGRMTLDVDAARDAIRVKVAEPLGISPIEAAVGIHRVVNENMANATRVHILEKGLDPRRFTMMAFGGAGPVHALQVARLLKLPRVIVPPGAGVLSALGFLVSPIAVEQMKSHLQPLDKMDWGVVNGFLEEMETSGRRLLGDAGVPANEAKVTRMADMRYSGQGHEITVSIPDGTLGPESVNTFRDNFYAQYEALYSRYMSDVKLESVSWRVLVSGPKPQISFTVSSDRVGRDARQGTRPVFFPKTGSFTECTVYGRSHLRPGTSFDGPAIIQEPESTLVVDPGSRVTIDEYLNLIVEISY